MGPYGSDALDDREYRSFCFPVNQSLPEPESTPTSISSPRHRILTENDNEGPRKRRRLHGHDMATTETSSAVIVPSVSTPVKSPDDIDSNDSTGEHLN